MTKHTKNKLLFYVPRVLSLLFVGFLSLFSLDVFSEYQGWEAILPFVIHLIPSFILLGIVAFAWKHPLFGAVLFSGFGLFYISAVGFDRPWSWYIGISGPSFLVSLLYFLDWRRRA